MTSRPWIEALKQMGANPVAVALPMGHGDDFKGVIDLLKMKARRPRSGESEIPSEFAEAATDGTRAQLVEAVAECDDSLLEKYLEEGELTDAEVAQGLVIGTQARQVTPVFCGVVLSEMGVETVMHRRNSTATPRRRRPRALEGCQRRTEWPPTPMRPLRGWFSRP